MTDQGGDLSPHSTTPDDLCCLSLQSGALPFAFIMYRLSALTFIARIGSATTRSTFVGAMSGHEGADVPDTDRSVALDAARLLAVLRRTLGMPAAGDQEEDGDDEDDDSSEGSSFFSGSGGEDEEEEEEDGDEAMDGPGSSFARELERQMGGGVDGGPMFHSQRPAGSAATPDTAAFHEQQVLWETETATDSDDEAGQEYQEEGEEEEEEEEEEGGDDDGGGYDENGVYQEGSNWPDPARLQNMQAAAAAQRVACLELIGDKAFDEL